MNPPIIDILLGIIPVSNKPFGKVVSFILQEAYKWITELPLGITDQNNTVLDNRYLPIILDTMSIFGADYESADSLTIMKDIDMNEKYN